jgi:hypothetical protein
MSVKDLGNFSLTEFYLLNDKIKFKILFIIIFFIHQIIFHRLLIFNNHLVGEDFIYYVPNMVFGKIWYLKNGLFIPPDFVAHQCGIIPFHADPNSAYYSFTQILFFFFDDNFIKLYKVTFISSSNINHCDVEIVPK